MAMIDAPKCVGCGKQLSFNVGNWLMYGGRLETAMCYECAPKRDVQYSKSIELERRRVNEQG